MDSRAIVAVIIVVLMWYYLTKYDRELMRARARPSMDGDSIIAQMQPGDLLLGQWYYDNMRDHLLFNRAYAALTGGVFTHASIVVCAPDGRLYVLDNYPEPRTDAYYGTRKTGPVLMDLRDFIDSYGGDLYYYKSNIPSASSFNLPRKSNKPSASAFDMPSLWSYVQRVRNNTYDHSIGRKISTIHKLTPNPDALKPANKSFCTETVSDVLKLMYPDATRALGHSSLTHPEDIRKFAESSARYQPPMRVVS
jgi:hypothetical protein